MKNATLVLMTIVIACCLIFSQDASAGKERYALTGPVVSLGSDIVLSNLTIAPGQSPTQVGGFSNNVDSFFDVFTELSLAPGTDYAVDSFFDITYQIDLGGGQFAVDSFFDVFTELTVKRDGSTGTFQTEIVSMSLTGSAGGQPTVIQVGSGLGLEPSRGTTKITPLDNRFQIDSFFDITYRIDIDGPGAAPAVIGGPVRMQSYPGDVPTPREVPGKEYSHHLDIDANRVNDPMQNLAWDGTGNAWDTFDYSGVGTLVAGDPAQVVWEQGTNVDAIANIQDRFFHEVVNDEVALLVTIDDGVGNNILFPGDYENIHYQTPGAASVAGIWAKGVIPGPASEIHTAAVLATAGHDGPWLNPTGIEVWGSKVVPPPAGSTQGTGDDAIMFSTNDDWNPVNGIQAAVWKYDPVNHTISPYILAAQIRAALGLQGEELVDVDGMMIYDMEKDNVFGQGDSIMFTVHTLPGDGTSGNIFDGGEIWVWNFDDGAFGTATFLNHGGFTWDTANSVLGIFPNVFSEENIGGLEAVPEPATMSLLALGGLAVLRRRRKR